MPDSPPSSDRALGMDRAIERRDFLYGVAGGVVGAALGGRASATDLAAGGVDPPERLGMRGSNAGSFEAAHALRDGAAFDAAVAADETYDLVVVGGGISGLSAAWFWRQARPGATVLVLDNHDDFGGHARRNQFHVAGRTLLANGGTLMIDSPRPYSPAAAGLLTELGVDPPSLAKADHPDTFERLGLKSAVFYDAATFGRDALVIAPRAREGEAISADAVTADLAGAPLTEAVKRDIVGIETGEEDYLPGLSQAQKRERLSRTSYADYLLQIVRADPGVIAYYQTRTHGEWGIGIDAVPALDAWGFGLPGFRGLKLDPVDTSRMGYTAAGYSSTGGSYRYHFPDGNASIARLLVRRLIPGVAPGSTAQDVVTAKVDYAALDRAGAPVRLRLSSLAVHAQNLGGGGGVQVTYVQNGRMRAVRGRACVMAGYNMMIPYVVPELPAAQKAALHQGVKVPLVYTSVAVRDWRAFAKLGIRGAECPGSYFSSFRLAPAQAIGGYRTASSPDEPILIQLTRTPCLPGAPTERDQHRAGRAELLATPFATFERNLRDQLGRALGPGGFDPARDVAGIMVNRWPHGYAYEYNPLYDPVDVAEATRPHVIGRQRCGAIAIANSDAGAAAYTSSAIDQARRAVDELLA